MKPGPVVPTPEGVSNGAPAVERKGAHTPPPTGIPSFKPRFFSTYYGMCEDQRIILGYLWATQCGRCRWDDQRHDVEREISAVGLILFGRFIGIER